MISAKEFKTIYEYNPETGVFTRIRKTSNNTVLGSGGYLRPDGYYSLSVDRGGERILAHRCAWLYMTGEFPPEGFEVDHRNRNRGDNRWSNLRLADRPLQLINTSPRSDNTSGLKGVSWSKEKRAWHSYINLHGKRVNLGRYKDWFDAVCARKSAENLHHHTYSL